MYKYPSLTNENLFKKKYRSASAKAKMRRYLDERLAKLEAAETKEERDHIRMSMHLSEIRLYGCAIREVFGVK